MKSIKQLVVLATASFFAATSVYAAMPSSAGKAKQVLTVTQKVAAPDASGRAATSITARVAPLANSTDGFGINILGTAVRFPEEISSMPAPALTNGMLESDILAVAKSHFKARGPGMATQMKNWMVLKGVSYAWYSYEQKLLVTVPKSSGSAAATQFTPAIAAVNAGANSGTTGTPDASSLHPALEERLLLWTMTTDRNGRLLFGDPKIVPPKPKTLYVVYTPLKVADKLPSDWKYPFAGTVFVQTRDENFVVLPGTDERIDVGGAFDEPAETVAAGTDNSAAPPYDRDANIPCMMDDKNPGCVPGRPSVRRFMDERGASVAVVDYIRKVSPVYDEVPVNSGNMVARANVAVTQRTLTFNGCREATYFNQGSFGFTLDSTLTRFLVSPSGQYTPVKETTKVEQSPTAVYSGTVTVKSADLKRIASKVINPLDPSSGLLVDASTLPLSALAAIDNIGSPQSVLAYRETPYIYTGSGRHNVAMYLACDVVEGTIQFSAGWQEFGANSYTNWSTTVNRDTYGTVFDIGNAATHSISTAEYKPLHPVMCQGTASYNGVDSITVGYQTNCDYGPELSYGNMARYYSPPTFIGSGQDGLASLFPQRCDAGYLGAATGNVMQTFCSSGDGGGCTTTPTSVTMSPACITSSLSGVGIDPNSPNSAVACITDRNGTTTCNGAAVDASCPAGSTALLSDPFNINVGSSDGPTTYFGSRVCATPAQSTWTLSW